METTSIAQRPRIQRTEQEIFSLMEQFESSEGITVKEFCEMQEISNPTFYNWQKQYRNRHAEPKDKGFMTLTVAPAPEPSGPALFAEVGFIKIYAQVPAAYLKELLP
jgi:hypothetical protein